MRGTSVACSCRDLKASLESKRREVSESKRITTSTLKHYDAKLSETRFMAKQLAEAQARIASQDQTHREQAHSLEKMSRSLEKSAQSMQQQMRDKELAEFALADTRAQLSHLEKTNVSLEEAVQVRAKQREQPAHNSDYIQSPKETD